jgi:oligosaccharide repeat unit polymerase
LNIKVNHTGPINTQNRRQFDFAVFSRFLLFAFSLLMAGLALLYILGDIKMSRQWPVYITACFAAWTLIYAASSYVIFKTVYLFTTAYIISLSVFHLGHIISHSVGWFSVQHLVAGSMTNFFQRAGWYCILALGSIGVGGAVGLKISAAPTNRIEPDPKIIERNLSATYWIGLGLLAASIVSLVLVVIKVGNIFVFSRTEIFAGIGDTRGFGFFLLVAPSANILLVCGARTKGEKLFSYSLAILTFFSLLFLGYRSSALFSALIGVIVWTKLGKKVPILVAAAAVIFVLISIPAVRYLRALGPYQDISREEIIHSLKESEVKDVFSEVGGVAGIVAYVLKWVPAEDPYRYGQSYWLALADAIPNVGLNQKKSKRSKFRKKIVINKKMLRKMTPSDWFIYRTNKWMFESGGGSGFSAIAEAYLNFGLPGVICFFSIIGFLLCRLDQVDLRMHAKTLIFSGAMLWPLLKSVRNTIGVFMKPLAFVIVSILIWQLITFWKHRSRSN